MKILVLDATDKSIEAVMDGAPTTNQPDFTVHYADSATGAFTEASDDGTLNGTTPVTLVAAPAASTQRVIREFTILNTDTDPVTITITYESGANSRRLWRGVLQPDESVTSDGSYDENGALKTAIATIPAHSHSSPSSGGVLDIGTAVGSGLLALEYGGTEADLSGTGPGFVKQATTGAPLSIGSIASADLTTALGSPPAIGGTAAAGKFTTLENTGAYVHNEAGADVDWRAEGDTDVNLLFLDASADFVGIGTNAPGAKLDVRGAVIINEAGSDFDVRIEGDTDTDLLHTDASQDAVGIGVAAPDASAKLDVTSTTKTFLPPRMTTTQRDAIGSPANGSIIYNSTHKNFNFRVAGLWTPMGMATLVARQALGSDGTFSFTSLSADFDDLWIRIQGRSDRAASTFDNMYIRLNADSTAANYYGNSITLATAFGNQERLGATATAFEIRSGLTAASSPTDYRGFVDFFISNYADSTRPRQCYWTGGVNLGDSTGLLAGLSGTGVWKNTSAAVNQIAVLPVTGTNLKAGSTISIWGLKAA